MLSVEMENISVQSLQNLKFLDIFLVIQCPLQYSASEAVRLVNARVFIAAV